MSFAAFQFNNGGTVYWSGLIIALGIAGGFFISCVLRTRRGEDRGALWAFLPFAMVFSVFFCRVIHWYCHMEQYGGFGKALSDLSIGSYCLPGILFGMILAAFLVRLLGFSSTMGEILDCAAPGAVFTVAVIRFSALFGSTYRSKIAVNRPFLQHLPLAVPMNPADKGGDYCYAAFFIEAIILLLVCAWLIRFCIRQTDDGWADPQDGCGDTARLALVLYSAVELLMDSPRSDSSFFHFTFLRSLNPYMGFISLIQLIAAISLACVLIYFSIRAVRENGLSVGMFVLWILYLLSLAAAGIAEYLVQRHGDWYLRCYALMSLGCFGMAFIIWRVYRKGALRFEP